METDLIQAMLADAGLAAKADDRISWNTRPQGEPVPAIGLTFVAGSPVYTMTGRTGLTGTLVQMDCWAATLTEALALRAALLTFLDALTAAPFQRCFVEAQRQGFEPDPGPAQVHFHRASLDVRVWHHA